MYTNKVTLIGFLGNDAEVRTNNDRSLHHTLAGNEEFLQEGRQVHRAHRMAPLRRLRQARRVRRHAQEGRSYQVEGELRSREYDSKKTNSKQTIWEIRVDSILKLDRAAKATPEEQESEESAAEEVAA